jgi:hypothetical protein
MVALTTRVSFGQGSKQKPYPPPLGRTGDFNRPSFAKRRRREEEKLLACCRPPDQSRDDLPHGKSVLIVLWD